ncbi:MAG: hypothetical protein AB7O45_12770 [Alphaproteobacteria bacterium]
MSDFDFDVVTGPIERRSEKPEAPAAPPVTGGAAVPEHAPPAAPTEDEVARTG